MDHLTNINTFRIICEQSQTVLEKYFKTLSIVGTPGTVHVQQELQLNQIPSFEFINIDNDQYRNNYQHDLIMKNENVILNTIDAVNLNNNNNADVELIKNENEIHALAEKSITVYSIVIQNADDNNIKINNNNNDDNIMNNCKIVSDCKLCGKGFKTIEALKTHIKRNKCTKKRLGCENCGKDFKTLNYLNKHKMHKKCFKRKTEKVITAGSNLDNYSW